MKVAVRVVLLGLLLVLCFASVLLTVWFHVDKPLVYFHLYRRSECMFHGTPINKGTAFKEGCEKCVCISSDNVKCETVKGCVQDDKIHVVVASDKHALGGMITLVNSIYHNTNASVQYHLIVTAQSHDHLKVWLNDVPLKFLDIEVVVFPEEWVNDKIVARGGREDLERPINYARTFLPSLLPNIHNKIIYIDADCIVQGDISELWGTKLQPGNIAAFSSDCSHLAKRASMFHNRFVSYLNFDNPLIHKAGLRPETCSFNTGVFVTDLGLWRHYNITEELRDWMTINSQQEVYGSREGGGGQQPLFLIVFNNKYTELDPFWNVRQLGVPTGQQYSRQFLQSAHLLHWNGRIKPWDAGAHYQYLWDKYYIKDPIGEFHVIRKFKEKN